MNDDEFLLREGRAAELLEAELAEALRRARLFQAVAETERERRLAYEAVLTKKQREQLGVKYDDENES